MVERKKYREMSCEEFITDILGIELSKNQQHLIRLFDENKEKKVEYISTYPIYYKNDFFDKPLESPTITYNYTDGSKCEETVNVNDLKV